MNQDEIRKLVYEIISKRTQSYGYQLKDNADIFTDLKADSLDFAEIAMDLEDAFNFRFKDGDENKIKTIGDAISLVEQRVAYKEEVKKTKTTKYVKQDTFLDKMMLAYEDNKDSLTGIKALFAKAVIDGQSLDVLRECTDFYHENTSKIKKR